MKYLYNINRVHHCWNRFGIEYAVWDMLLCDLFSSGQKLPIRGNFEPAKKNLRPTNYSWKKPLNPRNNQDRKNRTHEIATGKKLGPTKYPRSHDGRWH